MNDIESRAAVVNRSVAKRALDIAFAVGGLLATSPVWLVLPLAIRLNDGGPVFYRQPRSGRGGRCRRPRGP